MVKPHVACTAGRLGLEIVHHRLVGPVRLVAPASQQEVSTQWERPMFGDRQIGRVESVIRVEVEHRAARHDEIAVFLNNHRVRLQATTESLEHVEVKSQATGIGHQISLAHMPSTEK
jgi:hypothetical protein